jgi:citrate synthase
MARGARILLEHAKKAGYAARYARSYQTTVTKSTTDLRSRLEELVPQERERLKEIKSKYGKVSLGDTTVDMAIGGMRGIKGMLWETSLLDPEEGIRFRGLSIPECQAKLPGAKKGGEPLPEGFLWLLATGELPNKEQVDAVTADLRSRSKVPGHVFDVINALPKTAHPMTQFTAGIMALQTQSEFAKAYETGISKTKYWEPTYEDAMNLIARLPEVAAYIYRRIHKGGELHGADPNLDYAANFAQMLGFKDELMHELMRLYISIHRLSFSLCVFSDLPSFLPHSVNTLGSINLGITRISVHSTLCCRPEL